MLLDFACNIFVRRFRSSYAALELCQYSCFFLIFSEIVMNTSRVMMTISKILCFKNDELDFPKSFLRVCSQISISLFTLPQKCLILRKLQQKFNLLISIQIIAKLCVSISSFTMSYPHVFGILGVFFRNECGSTTTQLSTSVAKFCLGLRPSQVRIRATSVSRAYARFNHLIDSTGRRSCSLCHYFYFSSIRPS